MKEMHPTVSISYDTLRNSVLGMIENAKDAIDFVRYLECQETAGKLDFVPIQTDDETGLMKAVVWPFKSFSDIVKRCGQIAFCDSTYHLTKYFYKLSYIILIDAEGSKKTVLLSLLVHENANSFNRIFVSWHEAFGYRSPHGIITDGDEALFEVISFITYRNEMVHLL